ncbi:alanine racemase [Rhodococcoides kyotonense]|uniref:D-serine deaminase, pyridoxal phosphate-dependent n=1 Tax=Rhodococcoides kyotonense TaxID=398843 RepID=A0A239ID31_9NOCA|nr:alanine racemase [Rhodococcus kyotonensis]SNS91550.1 D-serine deaminase, pyridoxal phosphate-dependent [Rhodococcus kyotonensis]
MIDKNAVDALGTRVLGPEHKSVPPSAWGKEIHEFLAQHPRLSQFQTPLLTVDDGRMRHNVDVMAAWADKSGVKLAPHGKTTMAPVLWRRQLEAGAWAITLATVWQAQIARSFGVERIMLANALVDPVGLTWLARELDEHSEFEFTCWADGIDTVRAMTAILDKAGATRPVDIVVELGGEHGRTGARSKDEARAVAEAVAQSPRLNLVGVGGYEGALSHDRSEKGLAAVRNYLDAVGQLHRDLESAGLYSGAAIITAGGSAYQDLVVERLASFADEQGDRGVPTSVVLRSGAYIIHDDGFYSQISPMIPSRSEDPLTSAMHGWARVVSRPESGLALLDAGKRDLPFDEGLPTPQSIDDAEITALNDQHAFLRFPDDDATAPVGTVVRLGLSHPCTAFDKWRLIPVIDDADADDPRVVDLVHTFF